MNLQVLHLLIRFHIGLNIVKLSPKALFEFRDEGFVRKEGSNGINRGLRERKAFGDLFFFIIQNPFADFEFLHVRRILYYEEK